MTTDKNIENKLEELSQAIGSDESMVKEVMSRIDSKSIARPSGINIQNIWRIIKISPITKFAAAAVIVVTVLISINPFNGSLNGTTAAYAKVKEAVRNMPWMHISYSGYILDEMGNKKSEEGEPDTEIWYSFKSQVVIQKYHSGLIEYCDYTNQEVHTYNPDSKRIVITALSGKKFPLEAATPWSWLERNIQRITSFGGEVTRKKGQHNGQDVEVFEIASTDRPGIASTRCKIFVDKETSLPIAEERIYINTEIGKPQRIETGTFDYPEQGPNDIYAIGLPNDTQTINSLPLPAWWDIKRVYQSNRRKAPQKYIAIVTSELSIPNTPVEYVNIYYTDGVRFREERHFLFRPGPVGEQWRQQAAEIGNTFDSILKWSQECKAHGQISISIYDGNHCYNSHREDNGVWKTTKHTTKGKDRKMTASDFWHMCPITRIGWPDIRGYADVIQDNYARENKLIRVKVQTQEFYLNPNRDYICQKKTKNNQETNVIEYGQTKEGMWYPKRTKGLGKSNTIFLETDPEFPEGIFDPENLPK